MNNDRRSCYEQGGLPLEAALAREFELGLESLASPQAQEGAARFVRGGR